MRITWCANAASLAFNADVDEGVIAAADDDAAVRFFPATRFIATVDDDADEGALRFNDAVDVAPKDDEPPAFTATLEALVAVVAAADDGVRADGIPPPAAAVVGRYILL